MAGLSGLIGSRLEANDNYHRGMTMNESIARRPLRSALLIAGAAWTLAVSGMAMASSQADDEMAIRQLITVAYPKAIDSADWKAYGTLFTEDAELKSANSTTKGQQAIEDNFKARASRPRPPAPTSASGAPATTEHAVTDLAIKVTGDTATSTSSWQTLQTLDGKTRVAYSGNYLDKLRKVNGAWKFQSREILMKPGTGPPPPAPAPAAQ